MRVRPDDERVRASAPGPLDQPFDQPSARLIKDQPHHRWRSDRRRGRPLAGVPAVFVMLAVLLSSAASAHPSGAAASRPGWSATGSLAIARQWHTATLLPSGQVLVTGGCCDSRSHPFATAEVYTPRTGTWRLTGRMATPRAYHTATLLSDGQVLVAGGFNCHAQSCPPLASAEIYDPQTGTWRSTGAMATARYQHTATLLSSGQVLVAGGNQCTNCPLDSAEVYDPHTGTWQPGGHLTVARAGHTATLLPSGMVLVAGGDGAPCTYICVPLASADLYDPQRGTWSATGAMAAARYYHTATLLRTGQVLVAGGADATHSLVAAELYDPGHGTWTPTGSLTVGRSLHTATLLSSGTVLVAGGTRGLCCTNPARASAELYDPAHGTWQATAAMASPREFHTATLLPSGQVLAVGGAAHYCCTPFASAELYTP